MISPSQESSYELLRNCGFEYDYTAHDGCVFVKKYDYTRESRVLIDTIVIQPDGDYYSLPILHAVTE